jgi:5-methylcytosine-specific restriction protein A
MGKGIPNRRPLGYVRPREIRPNAYQRGYGKLWQRASKVFLSENRWCVECERQGRLNAADCVDHIKPHRGDMEVFWDATNWQPLCNDCHAAKTGRGE